MMTDRMYDLPNKVLRDAVNTVDRLEKQVAHAKDEMVEIRAMVVDLVAQVALLVAQDTEEWRP